MKTFEQWFNERYSKKLPKGNLDSWWFIEHNLPMVVQCVCCEMTMALPSAFIDEDNSTYCADCKGDD